MTQTLAQRVREIADGPHPWIPGAQADLIREIADALEEQQSMLTQIKKQKELLTEAADTLTRGLKAIEDLERQRDAAYSVIERVKRRTETLTDAEGAQDLRGILSNIDSTDWFNTARADKLRTAAATLRTYQHNDSAAEWLEDEAARTERGF